MILTDACITSYDGQTSRDGRVYNQEYTIRFTGDWLPRVLLEGGDTYISLPVVGEQFADDTRCYCKSVGPARLILQSLDGAEGVAVLPVQYVENIWIATSPLDQPDVVTWQLSEEAKEIMFDKDGEAIVNSAGDVFDSLASVNVATLSCTITGYRSTYQLPPVSNYHIVNSDTFSIDGISIGVGEARLVGAEARLEKVNGFDVIAHSWFLKFRATHDLEIVDMGMRERSGGSLVNILDENGVEVTTPYPLDGSGVALARTYNPSTDLVTRTFDITEDLAFSTAFGWSF
jgi:hypothetical protein